MKLFFQVHCGICEMGLQHGLQTISRRTSTMWQTFVVKLNISGMTKIQHISKYTMCQTDSSIAGRRDYHDDVIKWKHFPRYWPFVRGIHRSPVNSPHKAQWRGALMFSLICVWINDWVNNREAGDWRRYRDHYDVPVMFYYTGIGLYASSREYRAADKEGQDIVKPSELLLAYTTHIVTCQIAFLSVLTH